ncbi:MAG TPA: hypothetical protein VNT52_05105 [Acidimicrobiales bacterium]|nr:hypothetical protein [Acidimicrobiales bacterium]
MLIVIPAIIVAVAVVVVLDRLGVLPRLDGGPSLPSGGFMESIPRGALWGAGALMAVWILAWLIFLVVGLSTLAG